MRSASRPIRTDRGSAGLASADRTNRSGRRSRSTSSSRRWAGVRFGAHDTIHRRVPFQFIGGYPSVGPVIPVEQVHSRQHSAPFPLCSGCIQNTTYSMSTAFRPITTVQSHRIGAGAIRNPAPIAYWPSLLAPKQRSDDLQVITRMDLTIEGDGTNSFFACPLGKMGLMTDGKGRKDR